ncbi:MAG: aminotransferase class V-fold PLP-dependent enzyme [Planctomycetes bacterium]|nr:aminotransferase class V-fold PLP-dependent enzyme [Planctomycetota bacterium]
MRPATRLVRFEAAPGDPWRPLSTPIYQTAAFEQESATEFGAYDYTRSGNPTRHVLERELAALEDGAHAVAFTSGMAALSAVTRLAARGRIVAGLDLYGGTHRLLAHVCEPLGIEVERVDLADALASARALARRTDLVLVESPSNPLLGVVDVRALAELCRAHGALLCVDGSLCPPAYQQPLALGADLVVHSATKYLCGHGDVTAGVVSTRSRPLFERLAFTQNAEGAGLAPFECWLLLRGLKTLPLRFTAQQRHARHLARFLAAHPLVTRVHYPGLVTHPGHALHRAQSSGDGAVLSFETGDVEFSRRLVEALELFSIAVSFGSVHSQATLPCHMSHRSIPARERHGLPPDLVRLSVGIEDLRDLRADLEQALLCRPAEQETIGVRGP